MGLFVLERLPQTPYSKLVENTLFFCLHVNWPLLPCFKPNIPLNSTDGIEATRANVMQLHGHAKIWCKFILDNSLAFQLNFSTLLGVALLLARVNITAVWAP